MMSVSRPSVLPLFYNIFCLDSLAATSSIFEFHLFMKRKFKLW